MSEITKVYALLVGINEYPEHSLRGCVNDVKRMIRYLKGRKDIMLDEKTLYDEDATKEAIVETFITHLSQAGLGDVALFYFSGHGTQEVANTDIWTTEIDGYLETIVCHPIQKPFLLADKELRFLISELMNAKKDKQPHLLTIFDCCHSGDNTRSAKPIEEAEDGDIRERRYFKKFALRPWEEFIFSKKIKEVDFESAPPSKVMKEGPHIHMAAAQDKESALEISSSGVYTKTLIKVLKLTGGKIDYWSLNNLITNYIRFHRKQVPQLSGRGSFAGKLLWTGFLNSEVEYSGKLHPQVSYNEFKSWVMDIGSIYGVKKDSAVDLIVDGKEPIPVKIRALYADKALLNIDHEIRNDLGLDEDEGIYTAQVDAFNSYPVFIYIDAKDVDKEQLKYLEEVIEKESNPLQKASDPDKSDYIIHFEENIVYVASSLAPGKPVVRPYLLTKPNWLTIIERYLLNQIAKWEFVYHMHNNGKILFDQSPLSVEVYQKIGDDKIGVGTDNNEYVINEVYWEEENKRFAAYLGITLKNNFSRPLYVCVLLLDECRTSKLSVEDSKGDCTGLFHNAVIRLEADQEYEIYGDCLEEIPYKVEKDALIYNKRYSTSWLKFLISTNDDIPHEHLIIESEQTKRGGEEKEPEVHDWTTQLVAIKLRNPLYNKVMPNKIDTYLRNPRIEPIIKRLYLKDNAISGNWELKDGITHFEA